MPFATGAFKNEDLGFVSHPPAPKVFFWGFLGFARKPSCRAVVRQAHYERSFVSTVRPEYLYVREADRAYESDYGVRFSIRSLSPPPEVRPLPWREAERIGVGGFPQVPTKEGSALSGLSHRTGNGADKGSEGFPSSPTKEGSALSGLSCRTGNGANKGRSGSHKPHQRGFRPLWTLPPDGGMEQARVGGVPSSPTKEGSALSGLSHRTGNGADKGAEASPQAPPKRAPPSLDSPAGGKPFAWLRLRCATGLMLRHPLQPDQRAVTWKPIRPLKTYTNARCRV